MIHPKTLVRIKELAEFYSLSGHDERDIEAYWHEISPTTVLSMINSIELLKQRLEWVSHRLPLYVDSAPDHIPYMLDRIKETLGEVLNEVPPDDAT